MSGIFHSRYQQKVETARRVSAGLEIAEELELEKEEKENDKQRTERDQCTSQTDSR